MAMRAELMDTQERLRLAESDKACLEGDIASLKESVAERRAEAERELRKKERMEKEMKEMRVGLEARQGEIKQKQLQVRGWQSYKMGTRPYLLSLDRVKGTQGGSSSCR